MEGCPSRLWLATAPPCYGSALFPVHRVDHSLCLLLPWSEPHLVSLGSAIATVFTSQWTPGTVGPRDRRDAQKTGAKQIPTALVLCWSNPTYYVVLGCLGH